jgi:hypothetical protein
MIMSFGDGWKRLDLRTSAQKLVRTLQRTKPGRKRPLEWPVFAVISMH